MGEVGGWISTKKNNADIIRCVAMAKEARRRRLLEFAPPKRLEHFMTIYDGTSTTSNNVFSNNDNDEMGGLNVTTSNYRGTSFLEEAAIGPSNTRGRLPYYMTFDEKKDTAKAPTIAKTLSNVTLLPIIDTVMEKYRNSENIVCLPPKRDEELYAIGYEESDDGASKKKRKKEEDNMDNDLSEPRKVKKTARNRREDKTTAGDDDDEASEYQPNQVVLTVEKKKEEKKEKKIIKKEVLDKRSVSTTRQKNRTRASNPTVVEWSTAPSAPSIPLLLPRLNSNSSIGKTKLILDPIGSKKCLDLLHTKLGKLPLFYSLHPEKSVRKTIILKSCVGHINGE